MRKPKSEKRSAQSIRVWVTKAEMDAIKAAARKAGVSDAAYLRTAAAALAEAEATRDVWQQQVQTLNGVIRYLNERLSEAEKGKQR
jgi:hypothetical protein